MNSDQFVFWLQGFLEASPGNAEYVKSAIAKKMKDVKPVAQSYPYGWPYTWYVNTSPKPLDPTPKITCEQGNAVALPNYSTSINLPNNAINLGSNTMKVNHAVAV